jgi:hypothetical protein
MLKITIEFTKIKNDLLTGRDRGLRFRENHKLDLLDDLDIPIRVFIPKDIFAMTTMFFIGMFEQSVIKAGSREKFFSKYKFKGDDILISKITHDVDRILANHHLLINNRKKDEWPSLHAQVVKEIGIFNKILRSFRRKK